MGDHMLNENDLEKLAIEWLQDNGWDYVYGPDIAPDGTQPEPSNAGLPDRTALAYLIPVFSEKRMMDHIRYLADDELKGRGYGTKELDMAAEYLAGEFAKAGLRPGGGEGGYFQCWEDGET